MPYTIHTFNPDRTINWASGTSTELFIHPSNGNFQNRQFVFRISTATVEADETNFSDFTGLKRILMVLRGRLKLIHEGRYEKELGPFEQDTFDGSWKTRSKGRVQDFNVMCNDSCRGIVKHSEYESGKMIQPTLIGKWSFLFVFDGVFQLEDQMLRSGDLLEFDLSNVPTLRCLESGNCIEIAIMANEI